MSLENFTIFKNNFKEKETQPDYKINTKEGDEWVEWGACWKKQGSNGQYLSCSKSKPMDKPAQQEEKINPEDIPF